MRLSYLLRSYDNAGALAKTLSALPTVTPLPPMLWETRVIVGAALDDVEPMLAGQFPRVHVIRQHGSDEAAAIVQGLAQCAGEFAIVLDPQSHPMDHRSVSTALARLDRDASLGAVSGRFHAPGGSPEEPLLPTTLVGGASCFRRSTLAAIAATPSELVGPTGPLGLSFRMWNAGFAIERCPDMAFQLGALPVSASTDFVANFRAALLLARQYFPGKLASAYWADWSLRFSALARHEGRRREGWKALWSARKACLKAKRSSRTPLSDAALEGMLGLRAQATVIGNWARENSVWRVVLADFSGNLFATYNACKSVGLQIRCIADNRPAFEDLEYRGLPIVPASAAFEGGGIEGVIIANPYPWQAQRQMQAIKRYFKGPILHISGQAESSASRRSVAA